MIYEAITRLLNPKEIEHGFIGLSVMVFSIIITLVLVTYQRYVVRKTGSLAIRADSFHYATDILVNGGVILSLVLVMFLGWGMADPIVALMIASFIIYSAVKIARESLDHLMDRELPDSDRKRIIELVLDHPGVIECHDLKTRAAGLNTFVQLHISMDGNMTLHEAHKVSDSVESKILSAFPNSEVIIHSDPEGITEERQEF